jgi:hypothetical protein
VVEIGHSDETGEGVASCSLRAVGVFVLWMEGIRRESIQCLLGKS